MRALAIAFSLLLTATSAMTTPLPRTVLILDQSTHFGPWPNAVIGAIRSTINDVPDTATFYGEHLDLFRFDDPRYKASTQEYFREKYRDKPIGVIVCIGPRALGYALAFRGSLWPNVPVVFTAVDERTVGRGIPPGVTGLTLNLTLADMIKAARIVVPDLQGFAIVGTPLKDQLYYSRFVEELPEFTRDLKFIDLMGLSIDEVRQRVATLPDRTVIFYIGINFYRETTYVAAELVPVIAAVANRPIVVDAETFFGSGAIGGFIATPSQAGEEAGRLVLRILDGEDIANIPVGTQGVLKPIFDWRQLQRWKVPESRLPLGSEIRFRPRGIWEQYQVQILIAVAAFLLQTGLVAWLIYEHRRRHLAEVQSRNSMSELMQMNRLSTAGELSASIAHEVNQPLTGIVASASAALRWLSRDYPDLGKAQEALRYIVAAGSRASDIVTNIRAMFIKDTQERAQIDLNELLRSVLGLVYIDLRKHSIEAEIDLSEQLPPVIGNAVQLQQVILNLVMNAIDAMDSAELRVLSIKAETTETNAVHVSIADTGSGIDAADLNLVFKPLFTTKARGMGMGLSICKSIIESHKGRIWVSAGVAKGSVFHFELPAHQGSKGKADLSDPARAPNGSASSVASAPSRADEMIG